MREADTSQQTKDHDQAKRPADEETPFRRFEDLARKLIQVPKKELDERRNDSKS